MSVFHADLETSIKITGYTFESLIPLEGVDNVTTAIGYRLDIIFS
jgi:hypothetical protein